MKSPTRKDAVPYNKVLDLIYQETTLLQMKKEDKSEISSSLSSPVPRAGIEPARL